jgi:hypothetical protein
MKKIFEAFIAWNIIFLGILLIASPLFIIAYVAFHYSAWWTMLLIPYCALIAVLIDYET